MNSNLKQKYYEDIVALMPGHVYWKDKNGAFLGCNLEQARDAGFETPEQMIGKTDYDMPWSIQADYLREIDQKVMNSGRTLTIEELYELPDGTKKIYLSNKLPLFDDNGQVAGILGISFDITERKKLEEDLIKAKKLAEAANEAKTEFLENMRHDIRTPLTGIVGFADIIKKEATSKQIKEYADNLTAASHTLLEFLNDILEGIKVLTGEVPILKRKFNLEEMAEKIIDLVKPKAIEKKLTLSLTTDSAIPKYVVGDPKRTQRILLELVTNALNFTDKGSVLINISLVKKHERELIIQVQVKDTGIGIPEDKQEEIYVRFKRLVPSYKGIYKGAGLGLAIVKQFIDDLKGEIYCQSEVGIGTVFTCLLSLQESLLETDAGSINTDDIIEEYKITTLSTEKKHAKKRELGKTKVLIVEDQLLAAKVAQSIVNQLDCNADVAPDGNTALNLIKDKKYDLIFMDVGLPDISGFDLTKQIRANEWKLEEHVPIVALTAHIDTENKQECIISGMDAVLSKPLMTDTAKDIINAFVPSRKPSIEEHKEDKAELFNLSGKVIDFEEGVAKMNGNVEAAKEMIEILVSGLKEDLPTLVSAKENDDWEEIRSITHKLRGGCAYCGAQRLRQACINLEDYLAAKKKEWRDELFQQLIDEIKKIIANT